MRVGPLIMGQAPCFAGICGPKPKYWIMGQHTATALKESLDWLPGKKLPGAPDVKFSGPAFNIPELPAGTASFPKDKCQKLDVACFGSILDEVMTIFDEPGVKNIAKEMNVQIPEYRIDTFLQGKTRYIKEMASVAKGMGGNTDAVKKLSEFADAFSKLDPKTITNVSDWRKFVTPYVVEANKAVWPNKLAFRDVLGNFGFDQAFADKLRSTKKKVKDDKTGVESDSTWENEGCRWVAKSLGAYKPVGCLVDVVNLIFAMLEKRPEDVEKMKMAPDAEVQIKRVIAEFVGRLKNKDFKKLWVPNYTLLDCEVDDMLAWCLLKYIHSTMKTKYCVLVQLPADEFAEKMKPELRKKEPGLKHFTDPGSRNLKAIQHLWEPLLQAK